MWKIVFVLLSVLLAVEGSLVGGATDIDIHSDGVQNALNFAVAQHNRGNNDMFLRKAAEVVKAQVQVCYPLILWNVCIYVFYLSPIRRLLQDTTNIAPVNNPLTAWKLGL